MVSNCIFQMILVLWYLCNISLGSYSLMMPHKYYTINGMITLIYWSLYMLTCLLMFCLLCCRVFYTFANKLIWWNLGVEWRSSSHHSQLQHTVTYGGSSYAMTCIGWRHSRVGRIAEDQLDSGTVTTRTQLGHGDLDDLRAVLCQLSWNSAGLGQAWITWTLWGRIPTSRISRNLVIPDLV